MVLPSGDRPYCRFCPVPCVMVVDWSGGEAPGMDLLDAGGRSFEFEYDLNSPKRGQKVQIKTKEDARAVQRECERMAADGAHRPVVFRAFEQSGTNMHKNVFGERPKEARERPKTRSASGIPFVKRVGKP